LNQRNVGIDGGGEKTRRKGLARVFRKGLAPCVQLEIETESAKGNVKAESKRLLAESRTMTSRKIMRI